MSALLPRSIGCQLLWLLAGVVVCWSCSFGARADSCSLAYPMRVGIDVGHARSAPGAISATGKTEYDFNMRFAEELLRRAEGWPALQLHLLNAQARKLGLQERPQEAAARKLDLFLSIHHDSVVEKYTDYWEYGGRWLKYSDRFRGFSLFVWGGEHLKDSLRAAGLIGKYLKAAGMAPTLHHAEKIPGENRKLLDARLGIYAAPFAVLRHADMPAVLFEVGVIAHREEERQLEEPSHRARIQSEVLGALTDYCRGKRP